MVCMAFIFIWTFNAPECWFPNSLALQLNNGKLRNTRGKKNNCPTTLVVFSEDSWGVREEEKKK